MILGSLSRPLTFATLLEDGLRGSAGSDSVHLSTRRVKKYTRWFDRNIFVSQPWHTTTLSSKLPREYYQQPPELLSLYFVFFMARKHLHYRARTKQVNILGKHLSSCQLDPRKAASGKIQTRYSLLSSCY